MNEEFNPYAPQEQTPPAAEPTAQPYQPQPYQQPYPQPYEQPQYEQPQYEQPQYEQPPYPPQQYQQPYYPQQQYGQPYAPQYRQDSYYPPQRAQSKAPKVFAILSFVIGCVSLVGMLFTFLGTVLLARVYDASYTSPLADLASSSLSGTLFTAVPGLIFGVIALAKKTRLLPLAILGVVFNAINAAGVIVQLMLSMGGVYGG